MQWGGQNVKAKVKEAGKGKKWEGEEGKGGFDEEGEEVERRDDKLHNFAHSAVEADKDDSTRVDHE